MLIPLSLGLAFRASLPNAAGHARTVVGWISNVSMILVVSLTTLGHLRSVLGVVGTFAILAAIVFTAICVGFGWILGGPKAETRGVLALGTAQRNSAAAFVVAGQNFSDPGVVVMITVLMILEFLSLVPFARFLARRR
jgi:BASS family bile acid:Na+ symporter